MYQIDIFEQNFQESVGTYQYAQRQVHKRPVIADLVTGKQI